MLLPYKPFTSHLLLIVSMAFRGPFFLSSFLREYAQKRNLSIPRQAADKKIFLGTPPRRQTSPCWWFSKGRPASHISSGISCTPLDNFWPRECGPGGGGSECIFLPADMDRLYPRYVAPQEGSVLKAWEKIFFRGGIPLCLTLNSLNYAKFQERRNRQT